MYTITFVGPGACATLMSPPPSPPSPPPPSSPPMSPPSPPPPSPPPIPIWLKWLDTHRAESFVLLISFVADLVMALLICCTIRVDCALIFSIVFTITNISTKVLFAIQMARAGEAVQGSTAYLALQLCILGTSHVSGFAVIIPLVRSQHITADEEPGHELLDIVAFHERTSTYTLALIIGSANLQVLSLLPWKQRSYSGLPSASLLQATYVSTLCTDVPQLFLQGTYVVLEGQHDDVTISAISLACTALALWYRVLKRWLTLLSLRVIAKRQGRRMHEPALQSSVNQTAVLGARCG